EIRYFIGFPFDPLSDTPTGYDKKRFMEHLVEFEKYFDPREVLLAGELWDRLSGEPNTMEKILNIINQIAKPDFLEKFEFINNPENFEKDKERYMKILKEWFLFDEIRIFENYEKLKKENQRILMQELFKNGKYNLKRKKLLELI
ncbi:MAG: TdeIII family type II restriction endonuclease, partial [Aquificae bacterium]|nr:TdeIII family type II restriction endonuclease [Aquificota bacterium]